MRAPHAHAYFWAISKDPALVLLSTTSIITSHPGPALSKKNDSVIAEVDSRARMPMKTFQISYKTKSSNLQSTLLVTPLSKLHNSGAAPFCVFVSPPKLDQVVCNRGFMLSPKLAARCIHVMQSCMQTLVILY